MYPYEFEVKYDCYLPRLLRHLTPIFNLRYNRKIANLKSGYNYAGLGAMRIPPICLLKLF